MATKENHLTYNFAPFPEGLKSSLRFLQAHKIIKGIITEPPNQMFSTIRSVVCRLERCFNRHRTSLYFKMVIFPLCRRALWGPIPANFPVHQMPSSALFHTILYKRHSLIYNAQIFHIIVFVSLYLQESILYLKAEYRKALRGTGLHQPFYHV